MINIVNAISSRTIKDSWTLEGLVDFIKNPSIEHKERVLNTRVLKKGSPAYDKLKKTTIPCAVLNFNHSKGYVNGDTVTKPTGYLYVDVDGTLDIDLSSPYISAYWKSLSGTGYSIVVAVKGLTKGNYKSATMEVANMLDLPIDTNAISIDRLTCISYDPDAYYNPNAKVYSIQSTGEVKKVSNSLNLNIKNNSLYELQPKDTFKLRWNNMDDLYRDIDFYGEAVYDLGAGGKPFADVWFPLSGIEIGKRNRVMYSTALQLRALNEWAPEHLLVRAVSYVNKKVCKPPLSFKEIQHIVQSAFKVKSPKVIYNRKRRFLYNKDYEELTPRTKRELAAKKVSEYRASVSDSKIMYTIQQWDFKKFGKITMKGIAEQTGLSVITVKRRSSEIKEIIKQKNLCDIK